MFKERNSSGKHMIIDVKGIKNIEYLNNTEKILKLLRNICEQHKFDILKESYYEFEPIGCSALFLLSESHISIHTFP